ncbi:MAG: GNAT family N-acetyltransferase [Candidatus Lokiarchaeota archaeon]|nr:GNAT family N-acetyltransferase [Candidatus Lokiarchaeota archaeon]
MATFPSRKITLKNNKLLTIRSPELKDAQTLVEYVNQVSTESENLSFGPGDNPFTKEAEIQYINSLTSDPRKVMALGVIDGDVIAVADISCPSLPRLHHRGELGMSVMKSFWGIGVGNALMEYLIDWANFSGVKKVNLQVKEGNTPAINLYKKHGFKEEGRISRGMVINNKYIDTICMGLQL